MLGSREIEFIVQCIEKEKDPVPKIREVVPEISVTKCSASDIMDEPFQSLDGCNLYLVDRSDHCWKFTAEPAQAGGIVIALK